MRGALLFLRITSNGPLLLCQKGFGIDREQEESFPSIKDINGNDLLNSLPKGDFAMKMLQCLLKNGVRELRDLVE